MRSLLLMTALILSSVFYVACGKKKVPAPSNNTVAPVAMKDSIKSILGDWMSTKDAGTRLSISELGGSISYLYYENTPTDDGQITFYGDGRVLFTSSGSARSKDLRPASFVRVNIVTGGNLTFWDRNNQAEIFTRITTVGTTGNPAVQPQPPSKVKADSKNPPSVAPKVEPKTLAMRTELAQHNIQGLDAKEIEKLTPAQLDHDYAALQYARSKKGGSSTVLSLVTLRSEYQKSLHPNVTQADKISFLRSNSPLHYNVDTVSHFFDLDRDYDFVRYYVQVMDQRNNLLQRNIRDIESAVLEHRRISLEESRARETFKQDFRKQLDDAFDKQFEVPTQSSIPAKSKLSPREENKLHNDLKKSATEALKK